MQKRLGRDKKKWKSGDHTEPLRSSPDQPADNPFLWLWLKTQNLDQCFSVGGNKMLSLVKGSVEILLSLLCLEETGVVEGNASDNL